MKFCIALFLSLLVVNGYDCSPISTQKGEVLIKEFDPRVVGNYRLGFIRRHGEITANAKRFTVSIQKLKGPQQKGFLLTFDMVNIATYILELNESGEWTFEQSRTTRVAVDDETFRKIKLVEEILKSFQGFIIREEEQHVFLLGGDSLKLKLYRVQNPDSVHILKVDPLTVGEFELGVIRRDGKTIASAAGFTASIQAVDEPMTNNLERPLKTLRLTFKIGDDLWKQWKVELSERGKWNSDELTTSSIYNDAETLKVRKLITNIVTAFEGFAARQKKVFLLGEEGLLLELIRV